MSIFPLLTANIKIHISLELNKNPVPVATSPVLICNEEEVLLIWLVVVQAVRKDNGKTPQTKKRDNS